MRADTSNFGTELRWKTKCMNISYFSGIRSGSTTYNPKIGYIHKFKYDPFASLDNGDESCRQYCRITYLLNDETIKKLGLEKSRL